jgi:hypothetical protein
MDLLGVMGGILESPSVMQTPLPNESKLCMRVTRLRLLSAFAFTIRENEHYIVHLQAQFAESGLAADA